MLTTAHSHTPAAAPTASKLVEQWGEMWQVNFAPEKTQAMVNSRSTGAAHAVWGLLRFGGKCLSLLDCTSIKILGVSVDYSLCFDHRIVTVACQTSLLVFALRSMVETLEPRGTLTLYEAHE